MDVEPIGNSGRSYISDGKNLRVSERPQQRRPFVREVGRVSDPSRRRRLAGRNGQEVDHSQRIDHTEDNSACKHSRPRKAWPTTRTASPGVSRLRRLSTSPSVSPSRYSMRM